MPLVWFRKSLSDSTFYLPNHDSLRLLSFLRVLVRPRWLATTGTMIQARTFSTHSPQPYEIYPPPTWISRSKKEDTENHHPSLAPDSVYSLSAMIVYWLKSQQHFSVPGRRYGFRLVPLILVSHLPMVRCSPCQAPLEIHAANSMT